MQGDAKELYVCTGDVHVCVIDSRFIHNCRVCVQGKVLTGDARCEKVGHIQVGEEGGGRKNWNGIQRA